jgi:4-diphosphocytidyl-2-C-methyl-D-erythritol kinase
LNERTLTVKTPCKVNLFLDIKNKRPDGYHNIETVFLPLDFPYDRISVSDAPPGEIIIRSTDKSIPLDKHNLCWKAAEAYFKTAGISSGCAIEIEKNIPVAAGLGGGSGDAAAVLNLLNHKHNNLLEHGRMLAIAAEIGSDVPFFLNPVLSLGEGRGLKLTALDIEPAQRLPILLAAPLFPVTAAWAYRNMLKKQDKDTRKISSLVKALKTGDWTKVGRNIKNSLAGALYEKFPILEIIKNEMFNAGATGAEISGSGPSMFAVFCSVSELEEAKVYLRDNLGNAVKLF